MELEWYCRKNNWVLGLVKAISEQYGDESRHLQGGGFLDLPVLEHIIKGILWLLSITSAFKRKGGK